MRIAIVGAGITGLTAAYRLTQAGHTVDVYETSDTPGGLGTYLKIGDNHLERFYHHFFQSDKHIIALIDELGLSDKLKFYPSKTSIYYPTHDSRLKTRSSLHPFSGPLDLLKFSPIPLIDRIRCGLALAYLKYAPVENEKLDQVPAAQWLQAHAGEAAYRVIWEPLLVGKFEQWSEQIPLAWLKDRLRDRTFKLGYLDGSAKVVFDALIKQIETTGLGTIHLNTPVTHIDEQPNGVELKAQNRKSKIENRTPTTLRLSAQRPRLYDLCIITTVSPIADKLITSKLPAKTRKILQQQDELGAVCVILELDRQVQPHYWINVNDRTQPILVAVEHTNLIPSKHYGGRHIMYLANYLHRSTKRFQQDEGEIIEEYSQFLSQLNPSFKKSWIKQAHLSRVPRTQTLFATGSLHNRPPHKLSKHIYLGNIDQMYPHDRNLNLGAELGSKIAQIIQD